MAKLQLPFTADAALFQEEPTLPAIFWETYDVKKSLVYGERPLKVRDNLRKFYQSELNVEALDNIAKYLWLAGYKRPPASISESLAYYQALVLTEDAELHLATHRYARIYIKPFPAFLGQHSAWNDTIIHDEQLYGQALGFLTSYMCLIRHESDFLVAQEHKLIDPSVTWSKWAAMTTSVFDSVTVCGSADVSARYQYGDLALSRVHQIMFWDAFAPRLTPIAMTFRHIYGEYTKWTKGNLVFLGTIAGYIALVLTAMQVGLATNQLQDNQAFQRASYGFTVLSILGPVVLFGILSIGTFLWSCVTLFSTSRDPIESDQSSA